MIKDCRIYKYSAIAQSYCAVFVVSGVVEPEELLVMLEGMGMKPRVRRTS